MSYRTIKEDLILIKNWERETNDIQLRVFKQLLFIEEKEVWKNNEYYKSNPEYIKYAKLPFKRLLKDVFNFSYAKFRRMKKMTELDDYWQSDFLHGGWDKHMATLVRCDENQVSSILQLIHSGDKRKIYDIKCDLFPPKPHENKVNDWKKKYEMEAKLRKKESKLRKQAEDKIKSLSKELKQEKERREAVEKQFQRMAYIATNFPLAQEHSDNSLLFE